MRYVVVDTETTGLEPGRGVIIEFACILDDTRWWDRDIETLPHLSFFVAGEDMIVGDVGAFAFNAQLLKDMHEAMTRPVPEGEMNPVQPPVNIPNVVFRWLQSNGFEPDASGRISFNIAGKNVMGFDYQFLRHVPGWMDKLKARHRALDPAILFAREDEETLPDLQTCMRRADMGNEPVPHRAYGDCIITAQLLRTGLSKVWYD